MNLKYKIRTYNFWISLASAVLLLVRLIGQRFGFTIDSNAFMDIVTALCGVMVVLGIITMPVTSTTTETKTKKQKTTTEKQVQDIVDNMQEMQNETNLLNDENAENNEQTTEESAENCIDDTIETENINFTEEENIAKEEVIKDDLNILTTLGKNLKSVLENQDTARLLTDALDSISKNPEELISLVETLLDQDK